MKTRKYISLLLLCAIFCSLFCFCSCESVSSGKRKIVCTAFAQYDFILNILGDRAEEFDVIYLLDKGSDMHSYTNTISAADKTDILTCEMFVYIGGESEKWVDELLEGENTSTALRVRLIDHVGEVICHGDDHHGHSHGEHSHESDEHIWLSPKRASLMCDALCASLCEIDPDFSEKYRENCREYKEKLDILDKEYENAVSTAERNYLIFADRFPFAYLAHDYKINYSAAFDGCSTETGASFETVMRLASDINASGTKTLITLEKSGVNIVETLKKAANNDAIVSLSVNSLQSVSKKDIEEGVSYLSAMYENLDAFRKAMN